MKNTIIFLLALSALILLPACIAQPTEAMIPSTPPISATAAEVLTPTTLPTLIPSQSESGQLPVFKPTPRQNLEASNPNDFEMASGKLQLVEFFRFT